MQRCLAHDGICRAEHRLARSDGGYVWVESRGRSIKGGPRGPDGLIVTVRDIEERRQAEIALRGSEARYRTLFDGDSDAMFVIDRESGRLLDVNRVAQALYGYTREEMLALRNSDLSAEPEQTRTATAQAWVFVPLRWHHKKDGTVFAVEITASNFDLDGRPVQVAAVRDITERRRMAGELEASRGYLQTVLDMVNDAIAVHDANSGQLLDCNSRLCEMFGYTRDEVLQASIGELSQGEPPYTQAEAMEWLGKVRAEGPQTSEWLARRRDGELFWAEMSARYTEIGGAERFVVSVRDIGERKRGEGERIERERRLLESQRLESLGVLAGGLAHDFNNLLMAISGSLDLVRMRLPQDSSAARPIAQAKASLKRAADLTKQMLAYSGRGRVVIEPLSVSRVVESMGALLASTVTPPMDLRVHLDPAVPSVQADAAQVRQVVLNLVLNAVEACAGRSGKVEVEVKARDCDDGYLAASCLAEKPAPGRFVSLAVSDNGCGIDEATRARLFEPFFSTKLLGRGLGLPAVQGIVRAHQGAIILESAVGWGTTVTILLPVAASLKEPTEAEIGRVETPGVKRSTILVVEDQQSVREVMAEMLEEAGYRALMAADGQAAVAVMREHGREIDCVLLDLSLPGLDGVATLGLMRELVPHVRVLVVSGSSGDEVSRRFSGHLVAGVLQKPYDFQTLLDELQRILQT